MLSHAKRNERNWIIRDKRKPMSVIQARPLHIVPKPREVDNNIGHLKASWEPEKEVRR